jgi:hypothetical protein
MAMGLIRRGGIEADLELLDSRLELQSYCILYIVTSSYVPYIVTARSLASIQFMRL